MRWKGTDLYFCQASTVAISSLLSCLIGMGEIALGIWLIVSMRQLKSILGDSIFNSYYAFAMIGTLAIIAGGIGCFAGLIRRNFCLVVDVVLLLESILCQIGVWTFIYVQQNKLSSELVMKISANPQTFQFIDHHYNCRLQTETDQFELFLSSCADFINRRLWELVWIQLWLCASLICLQFMILVMVLLLIRLVKRSLNQRVQPRPQSGIQERELEEFETSTTIVNKTADFTPPPSAPPLPDFHPTALPDSHPTAPPVFHPTAPPVSHPTAPPVSHPTAPPVSHPAAPPVSHPAAPPVSHPAAPPVSHPAAPPVSHPTAPHVSHPSTSPVPHPGTSPVSHPSTALVPHPSTSPVSHPSTLPVSQPSTLPVSHPSRPSITWSISCPTVPHHVGLLTSSNPNSPLHYQNVHAQGWGLPDFNATVTSL